MGVASQQLISHAKSVITDTYYIITDSDINMHYSENLKDMAWARAIRDWNTWIKHVPF